MRKGSINSDVLTLFLSRIEYLPVVPQQIYPLLKWIQELSDEAAPAPKAKRGKK
jgi:hypothetical protein